MIINKQIKELIQRLERASTFDKDALTHDLVRALDQACFNNQSRYEPDLAPFSVLEPYPIDKDGYAVSYDPIEDEKGFWEAWQRYGIVVGKGIASPMQCAQTITRIQGMFNALSEGACDIEKAQTYAHIPHDDKGTSIVSRGFLEVYHDDAAAQLRQNIRAYIHHVLIWGSARLWTSFDRFGVKLPEDKDEGGKALPLHVDQNPVFDPQFKTLQGVLALADCPLERGTYRGVAGSRSLFNHYADMSGGIKEFVELDETHPIASVLQEKAQALPLRAGDMVSWDSRTTHANTPNISSHPRYVFYMAAGLAAEDNEKALKARHDAFTKGAGTTPLKVPEALLRASIKPRYTNETVLAGIRQTEDMTLLGKLLYGQAKYKHIIA